MAGSIEDAGGRRHCPGSGSARILGPAEQPRSSESCREAAGQGLGGWSHPGGQQTPRRPGTGFATCSLPGPEL